MRLTSSPAHLVVDEFRFITNGLLVERRVASLEARIFEAFSDFPVILQQHFVTAM
jgi:hypothetical protein